MRLKYLAALLTTTTFAAAFASAASADEFIYANNAGFGPDIVYKIDLTTGGNVVANYDVSSGNGRGVVVVGNIMYTTNADSNNVYAYDLTANASLGVQFTVAGASALSTMAFDGTNFWIGDYSGSNKAYLYTPTGTLLKTISLANCTGNCDGLEYIAAGGGELVENRGDDVGPYDVYDTNGNLLTTEFINSSSACGGQESTGIAFDGTDYFISCFNKLGMYSSTGAFISDITVGAGGTSGDGTLIEDLSADYKVTLAPPPPTGAPEPFTLSIFGAGLAGAAAMRRRKAKSA